MRSLLFGCLSIAVLSGCGELGSLNLGEHPDWSMNNADWDDASRASRSTCQGAFVTALIEEKVNSYKPTIRFAAGQRGSVIDGLTNRSSLKERCDEVQNHLSGFSIKDGSRVTKNNLSLDIKFGLPPDATDEMLLGRAVSVRPTEAYLEFTDGSRKDTGAQIELRCPGAATVSCRITEIGDYKKCDSYVVDYADSCTFRNSVIMYSFSDHQKAQLDIAGELRISGNGEAQLKFTKVVWDDMY